MRPVPVPSKARRTWSECLDLCCLVPARTHKPPARSRATLWRQCQAPIRCYSTDVRHGVGLTKNTPRTTNSATTSGGSGGSKTCTVPMREKLLRGVTPVSGYDTHPSRMPSGSNVWRRWRTCKRGVDPLHKLHHAGHHLQAVAAGSQLQTCRPTTKRVCSRRSRSQSGQPTPLHVTCTTAAGDGDGLSGVGNAKSASWRGQWLGAAHAAE